MKKIFMTIALCLMCAVSFAKEKVVIPNDTVSDIVCLVQQLNIKGQLLTHIGQADDMMQKNKYAQYFSSLPEAYMYMQKYGYKVIQTYSTSGRFGTDDTIWVLKKEKN